jgi:hypothetical protein
MPFCAECGTRLDDGARFCAQCGSQQQQAAGGVTSSNFTSSAGQSSGHRCRKCTQYIPTDQLVIVGGFEHHRQCAGIGQEREPQKVRINNEESCPRFD